MHGAFKSLLQGDHLGVEFAASAHEGLLRGSGITGDPPGGRLLNRCPVASNVTRWAGLIIDDLFAISAEEVGPGGASTLSGPRPFSARLKSFTRLLALRGPTKRTSSVPGCSLSLALKSTPPPRACLREVFKLLGFRLRGGSPSLLLLCRLPLSAISAKSSPRPLLAVGSQPSSIGAA